MNRLLKVLFLITLKQIAFAQSPSAGRDTIVIKGKSVVIGSQENNTSFCYSWIPKDGLNNASHATPTATPTQKTVYKLIAVGNEFSSLQTDEIEVSVLEDVKFTENTSQIYGFDDGIFAYNNAIHNIMWKSIGSGNEDVIDMEVTPFDAAKWIHLKANSDLVSIAPSVASSSPQTLKVKDVTKGQTKIEARCGGTNGNSIQEINLASYTPIYKTLSIRTINEKGYPASGTVDRKLVENFLNEKVYNQAACQWLVVEPLSPALVSADFDQDGHIDVSQGSLEAKFIIDNFRNDDYDFNIFLIMDVYFPTGPVDERLRLGAVQQIGDRHVFISVNGHGQGQSVLNTIAHELGHAQGLRHPNASTCNAKDTSSNYLDPQNIMDYCGQNQLRKFQWDIVNIK